MKYGIDQEGLNVKCANCETEISSNGECEKKYCPNCGAPLTFASIAEYENNKSKVQTEILLSLTDLAQNNNTDSFTKILKLFEEEDI